MAMKKNNRKKKLSIIGAGAVGTAAAQWAVCRSIADTIVLLDVVAGLPHGKALDLFQTSPLYGYAGNIVGTDDYADTAESDVIIITAGLARKPGMSRDDLLEKNVRIIREVTEEIVKYSPDACLVVVTNPIDAMVYTVFKISGFPKHQVVGMAGVLDSARYRTFIAQALAVAPSDVTALVMGVHGDHMLPLVRLASVGGVPIEGLLSKDEIENIVRRTQHGGAEIVVLPCAAYLEGEFGVSGVFLGVPVVLGRNGVERIMEFPLAPDEQEALQKSVEAVKKQVAATGL